MRSRFELRGSSETFPRQDFAVMSFFLIVRQFNDTSSGASGTLFCYTIYAIPMKRIIYLLTALVLIAPESFTQQRGYPYAPRLNSWRLTVEGGIGVLGDDLTKESEHYHFRPIGGVEVGHVVHRNVAVGTYAVFGFLRSSRDFDEVNTSFYGAGLFTELRVPTFYGKMFPLLQLRLGGIAINPELRQSDVIIEEGQSTHLAWSAAAGLEVISNRSFGVRILIGVTYTSTDRWDTIVRGDDRDGYSFAHLGLSWYISRRR